jgi:hypothetical protein
MAASDVMKEYLVKLGFSVDSPAYSNLQRTIKEIEANLNKLSRSEAFAVLTKGASMYVSAVAAASAATAGLLEKVAEADLGYEKLALSMRTTKQTAMELDIAQKALGASFEEIIWIPELNKQFNELRRFTRELAPPADFEDQMKKIREVSLEFDKLKIMMAAGAKWIAYQITKYIDFDKVKQALNKVQAWIRENLPNISSNIARFIRGVVGSFEVVYRIASNIFMGIKRAIEILPEFAQAFVMFGASIALAFRLNPMIASLMLLFTMLEDYWAFTEGKRTGRGSVTLFGPLWESLEKGLPGLQGSLKELEKSLKSLFGQKFELSFWKNFNKFVWSVAKGIQVLTSGISQLLNFGNLLAKNVTVEKEIRAKYEPAITASRGKTAFGKEAPFWLQWITDSKETKKLIDEMVQKIDEAKTKNRTEALDAANKLAVSLSKLMTEAEVGQQRTEAYKGKVPSAILPSGAAVPTDKQGLSKSVIDQTSNYTRAEKEALLQGGDVGPTYNINIQKVEVVAQNPVQFYKQMTGKVPDMTRQVPLQPRGVNK